MAFSDQDPIAPLENLLNQAVAEANANVDQSRPIKSFVWADQAEREAQTGMSAGDMGYQSDIDGFFSYTGTDWKVWGSPKVARVVRAAGSSSNSITATSTWAQLSNPVSMDITLDRPAWFRILANGWATLTGSGDMRVGIQLSGATSETPQHPGSRWGNAAYLSQSYSGTLANGFNAQKYSLLNTGTTTISMVAYRGSGSPTAQISYPFLEAVFDAYDG